MEDLVKEGIISSNSLKRAKMIRKKRGGNLSEILVEMNAIDVKKFISYIKNKNKVEF